MENTLGAMVECKCQNKSCGARFMARVADRKRGWGKFCSKSCKAIKQERKNGQHKAYLQGRGVSNLHPKRYDPYLIATDVNGKEIRDTVSEYYDSVHPFSDEAFE